MNRFEANLISELELSKVSLLQYNLIMSYQAPFVLGRCRMMFPSISIHPWL